MASVSALGGRGQRVPLSDGAPSNRGQRVELLEGIKLHVHFGGVNAVDEVDITLQGGEILGLIGPNGAGKTTLVNALTGFQSLARGQIRAYGVDVTSWSAARLVRCGVARTFQGARIFPRLSVRENVEVAALGIGYGTRAARREAEGLLDDVQLGERARVEAGSLPYGEERLLSIARALASQPRFLLLDEPGAGLSDAEKDQLIGTIAGVRRERGCGILVIEHDMQLIMNVTDRVQVLNHGKTLAVGAPNEVRENPKVIEAYLGDSHSQLSLGQRQR